MLQFLSWLPARTAVDGDRCDKEQAVSQGQLCFLSFLTVKKMPLVQLSWLSGPLLLCVAFTQPGSSLTNAPYCVAAKLRDVWAVLEHSLGADTLPCCMESSGRTVLWKWRAVLTRAPGSRLFSEETRHLKGLWF